MIETRHATLWCALARCDVDVEFELRGIPGLRGPRAVRTCSAYEPPTAIVCGRRCLDADFRRQWEPALPVYTHEIA